MTGVLLRIIAIYLLAVALYTWAGWTAVRRAGARARVTVWLISAFVATSFSVVQLPALRSVAAGSALPPAVVVYTMLGFTLWLTAFGAVTLVLNRHRAAPRFSIAIALQVLGAYVVALLVWGSIVLALGSRLGL